MEHDWTPKPLTGHGLKEIIEEFFVLAPHSPGEEPEPLVVRLDDGSSFRADVAELDLPESAAVTDCLILPGTHVQPDGTETPGGMLTFNSADAQTPLSARHITFESAA